MARYELTRGINCRRYFTTTVEANSPEDAFEKGKALLAPEHAGLWSPDFARSDNHNSMGHVNDLLEPCSAAEEALCVYEPGGDIALDFTDIPNADEPASYAALLAFARRVANMVDVPDFDLMDDDRLESETAALRAMVGEARTVLGYSELNSPSAAGE